MWDFSVRNKSLPFDSVCGLDKSELELWLHSPVSRNRTQKLPLGLFVLFLSPTVQLEVVSQHHELRHKQHTNSCKQHVHNFHVLVLLCSWDSSGSFQLGISASKDSSSSFPPFARCHHQKVLHLDSELSLDLQAHCSAILVSRLLTLLRKTLLGIVHIVGFCRLHFSVQVEIESVVLEIDWNELVLSILVQQFLK